MCAVLFLFLLASNFIDALLLVFSSDAFDTEKLLDSMENLRHGQAVDIPNYDFKSYKNNVFSARRVRSHNVRTAC